MSTGNRVDVLTPGDCHTNFIPNQRRLPAKLTSHLLELFQAGLCHVGYAAFQSFTMHSLYLKVPKKAPIYSDERNSQCNPGVGYNHKMSANTCSHCAWSYRNDSVQVFENAVIIPLSELQFSLRTIKDILDEAPTEFPLTGIYVRFLAASEGLLTPSSGYPSASIEWVLVARKDRFNKPMLGLPASQAIVQALVGYHVISYHHLN